MSVNLAVKANFASAYSRTTGIGFKYAEFSSTRVREDLKENHGREISRSLVHVTKPVKLELSEPESLRS